MTDLSPAAKAVMDAYDNSSWDYETGEFEAVAAVIRAAVDQVVPVPRLPYDSCCDVYASAIRADFLAIAFELDAIK